jgi:hypothetical protein
MKTIETALAVDDALNTLRSLEQQLKRIKEELDQQVDWKALESTVEMIRIGDQRFGVEPKERKGRNR